jgi:DNA primase
MISPSTIEAVRELSIVDVVSHFDVDLKKAGANYRAVSPFSNEKTPSFYVVPSKGIFKDFSSGRGGNGVKFVMEKEGLGYVDAIKEICKKFSIQVEYEVNGHPKEYYDEIETLYKINEAAANLYAKQLLEIDGCHPAFHELINKRRFSPDTILQWQIGFAPGAVSNQYTPEKWNFLCEVMVPKGFYQQGIDLGLIKTTSGRNYDTFRSRIMFPIVDHYGRTVGFGGRATSADDLNPKYINSGESKIFNKSRVLYGLNFAAQAIRKKGYANLTEGYTDVISFHQADQTNTVGTCGTALTDEQAKLLRKYTNKVVLIYDPDKAGQDAAANNINLLSAQGFQTSIVPLPSVVQKKDGWRETVFITARDKERITVDHDGEEFEIPIKDVEAIEKIDPDELIRMF